MTKNIVQEELKLDFEMTLMAGSIKGAMASTHSQSRDLWQVPIDEIKLLPNFNTRVRNDKYEERVEAIANSMLLEGFKQNHPLAGFIAKEGDKNVIYLYGGHRRYEAVLRAVARGADIKKVPMVMAPAGTSMEDLTVDLVTGNGGEELTQFEVGVVCKRLINFGWTPEEIATRLFMKELAVNDLLMLMGSPKYIRDMVQTNAIAASEAIKLLHKHGIKAVDVLKKAQERAQSAGKSKVTAKHMPGAVYKKAVMKSAPTMVTALKDVKADPAFESLSDATKEMLADLLAKLANAESEDSNQGRPVEQTGS